MWPRADKEAQKLLRTDHIFARLYRGGVAGTQSPKHDMAGVTIAQRQMAFVHPFSFEFKRLANDAMKRGR